MSDAKNILLTKIQVSEKLKKRRKNQLLLKTKNFQMIHLK